MLPHSGRKKKIKNSLQSLTNIKTILSGDIGTTKMVVPIWGDVLTTRHEYVRNNYIRRITEFFTDVHPQIDKISGFMFYGVQNILEGEIDGEGEEKGEEVKARGKKQGMEEYDINLVGLYHAYTTIAQDLNELVPKGQEFENFVQIRGHPLELLIFSKFPQLRTFLNGVESDYPLWLA